MGISSLSQANAEAATGLVLVATSSFSAASTVSINGCFTTSYQGYLILVDATPSGAAVDLQLRLRVSGADNSTSNYNNQAIAGNATSVTAARTAATTQFRLGVAEVNRSAFEMTLVGPNETSYTTGRSSGLRSSASALIYELTGHYFAATTAFDGFTVYPSSGTITGTCRAYGYRSTL